jgi:serine protease Do
MNIPRTVAPFVLGAVVAGAAFALGSSSHAWLTRPASGPVAAPSVAAAPAPAGLPDFTQLVQRNAAAVVNLSVKREVSAQGAMRGMPEGLQRFFRLPPDAQFEQTGVGSGFVIDSDGYILTNAHVVDGANEISVKFSDKRELPARVVGVDALSDIALVKVKAKDLAAVQIGRSDTLQVGQWVLAIGSPFGFEQTASQGIVSALGRSLPGDAYVPFVQTDVPINPGNSGGPLIDLAGRVVGVNSQIYSRNGGYQGIAFAIPIDMAMKVAEQLKRGGAVVRGWLGVGVQTLDAELAASFKLDQPTGALIASVAPKSPAAAAGLKPGDVIRRYDGQPIVEAGELSPKVALTPPGRAVPIEIWRQGRTLDLKVTVAKRPAQT